MAGARPDGLPGRRGRLLTRAAALPGRPRARQGGSVLLDGWVGPGGHPARSSTTVARAVTPLTSTGEPDGAGGPQRRSAGRWPGRTTRRATAADRPPGPMCTFADAAQSALTGAATGTRRPSGWVRVAVTDALVPAARWAGRPAPARRRGPGSPRHPARPAVERVTAGLAASAGLTGSTPNIVQPVKPPWSARGGRRLARSCR